MRPSRAAASGFARDFQDFVMKGNIVDLAVGVIIGTAFGKIVTSFVETIIMPVISTIIPGGTWRDAKIVLGEIPDPKNKEKLIENAVLIGQFLGGILDFIIIAFVIFMMIRVLASIKRKDEKLEAADTKECPYCLSTIPMRSLYFRFTSSDVEANRSWTVSYYRLTQL
jgi:large conductance mechanosensitive channel